MFFVINKEKLYAYIVSVVTVMMLFGMAGVLMPNNDTVETSSNISNNVMLNKENENKNVSNE